MSSCPACHVARSGTCANCAADDGDSIDESAETCHDCQASTNGPCVMCSTFVPLFRRLSLRQIAVVNRLLQDSERKKESASPSKQGQPQALPPVYPPTLQPQHHDAADNKSATTTTSTSTQNNNNNYPIIPSAPDPTTSPSKAGHTSAVPEQPSIASGREPPELVHLAFWSSKQKRCYHYFASCKQYANKTRPASCIARTKAESMTELSLCTFCESHFRGERKHRNMFQ